MKPHNVVAIVVSLCTSFSFAGNAESNAGASGQATAKPKMYRYQVGGVTTFSDIPPIRQHYVTVDPFCFACNPFSSIDWDSTRLFHNEFSDVIDLAARKYRIDPALVRAVIHAESGFNARARSPKGAKGLMQLMPATAHEAGVKDAYVPEQNIHGGTQYLAGMLAQFNQDVTLAAAAYNAGPGAVGKYQGVPPYAETQAYVKRVNILYRRYREKARQ
jgi:soluble lytic murein transglycosylase-like protein